MADQNVQVIGGREWRTITNPILDRQAAFEVTVSSAGLETLEQFAAEPLAEFLVRAVRVLYANEQAWAIYGLLLLPAEIDDSQWTRSRMKETAEFFRTLQGPDDQRAAQRILAEGLLGFFASRLPFDVPSRMSLEAADLAQDGDEETRPVARS